MSRFATQKAGQAIATFAPLVSLDGITFQVPSSSGAGFYSTTVDSCTCPAGQHGRPCKHREAVRLQVGRICLDCSRPRCPRLAADATPGVEYCGGSGRYGCTTFSIRPSHNVETSITAADPDSVLSPPASDPGVLSVCVDCGHKALVFAGGFPNCRKCITGGFMRPIRHEVAS